MTIPAVGFLEMALAKIQGFSSQQNIEALQNLNELLKEINEFNGLGDSRLADLRIALPGLADIERGYILGLETMRVLIAGMPDLTGAREL